jgi:hypothetical protein
VHRQNELPDPARTERFSFGSMHFGVVTCTIYLDSPSRDKSAWCSGSGEGRAQLHSLDCLHDGDRRPPRRAAPFKGRVASRTPGLGNGDFEVQELVTVRRQ